jgi:hypothetical protein
VRRSLRQSVEAAVLDHGSTGGPRRPLQPTRSARSRACPSAPGSCGGGDAVLGPVLARELARPSIAERAAGCCDSMVSIRAPAWLLRLGSRRSAASHVHGPPRAWRERGRWRTAGARSTPRRPPTPLPRTASAVAGRSRRRSASGVRAIAARCVCPFLPPPWPRLTAHSIESSRAGPPRRAARLV